MSGMLAHTPSYHLTCSPEDVLASQKIKEVFLDFYYDIFAKGEYPSYITSVLEKKGIMPVFEAGDEELLKENTVDYLAFSYYQSNTVKASEEDNSLLPGIVPNPNLKSNEWGWAIDPIGLRIILKDLYARYKMPIFVVENGIGVREELDENNTVIDDYRIDYLRKHIEQMKLAMEEGVDVIGYLI